MTQPYDLLMGRTTIHAYVLHFQYLLYMLFTSFSNRIYALCNAVTVLFISSTDNTVPFTTNGHQAQ